MPVAVALVGYGQGVHSKVANQWWSDSQPHFDGEPTLVLDWVDLLREMPEKLGDDRVTHGQDAGHDKTLGGVLGQRQFGNVMVGLAKRCLQAHAPSSEVKVVCCLGACHKGDHRADTWRRIGKDMLNMLLDANGERMFNCQSFTLRDCGHAEQNHVLDQAARWANAPWCEVPRPEELYGKEAAMLRENSMEQWDYIRSYISKFNGPRVPNVPPPPKRGSAAVVSPPSKKARPSVAVPSAAPGFSESKTTQPEVSSGREGSRARGSVGVYARTLPPKPPSPPKAKIVQAKLSAKSHGNTVPSNMPKAPFVPSWLRRDKDTDVIDADAHDVLEPVVPEAEEEVEAGDGDDAVAEPCAACGYVPPSQQARPVAKRYIQASQKPHTVSIHTRYHSYDIDYPMVE